MIVATIGVAPPFPLSIPKGSATQPLRGLVGATLRATKGRSSLMFRPFILALRA